MEDSLKKGLKRLKANESSISFVLGILVLMAIVLVLINFFRDSSPESQITPQSAMTTSEDIVLADIPESGDTQFEFELVEDNNSVAVMPTQSRRLIDSESAIEQVVSPTLEINDQDTDSFGFASIMDQKNSTPASSPSEVDSETSLSGAFIVGVTSVINRISETFSSDSSPNPDTLAQETTATEDFFVEETQEDEPEIEKLNVDDANDVSTADGTIETDQLNYLDRITGRIAQIFESNDEVVVSETIDMNEETAERLPAIHQVQSGEHLWSIAQEYYGNGYNWVDIAEVNGLQSPDLIAVGMELSVPNVPVRNEAGQVPEVRQSPDMVMISATIEGGKQHTVSSGDSLWTIASTYYGNGLMWNKLYDANSDTVANPDRILVGQQLRIPQG